MYKNIILPVDLSDIESLKSLFNPALNFANLFDAKLHLVHVISDFGAKLFEDYLPRRWIQDQKSKSNDQLQQIIKRYIPSEISVESHIVYGTVYDEIIGYSEKVNADLIIVSAVSKQLRNYMLGPNASKIVRHSKVSVLVVRD